MLSSSLSCNLHTNTSLTNNTRTDNSFEDEYEIPGQFQFICSLDDIAQESGVCALIGGVQVAIFRTEDDQIFALENYDPYSNAYVLSRGLLGETQGRRYVASPMYKQRFDLHTGECLDGDKCVDIFNVFTTKGQVYFSTDVNSPVVSK
jgi:nitrite reductase (NADH) small subunit